MLFEGGLAVVVLDMLVDGRVKVDVWVVVRNWLIKSVYEAIVQNSIR